MAARLGPLECELLYGRAGLLYALLYARRQLGDAAVPDSLLHELAQHIIAAGVFLKDAYRGQWLWASRLRREVCVA